MNSKNYDTTVARIAGNLMSGIGRTGIDSADRSNVAWAVKQARDIVEETRRTEPDAAVVPVLSPDPVKAEPKK